MSNLEIEKIKTYLCSGFPSKYKIKTLCKTFEILSKDPKNNRNLVHNKKRAICFDLLSRNWIYKPLRVGEIPKSADALTFCDRQIILIEFKSGDQDTDIWKRGDLLNNVKGKIIDSDKTLQKYIFGKIPDLKQEKIEQDFYLVIDAGPMEQYAFVDPMIYLSEGSSYLKETKAQKILSDLLSEFSDEDEVLSHYRKVDIWYSELFDFYLDLHNIKDLYLE